MSNLWQLSSRFIIFCFFGIVLINLAYAFEFGISPAELNLTLQTNETKCSNYTIYLSEQSYIKINGLFDESIDINFSNKEFFDGESAKVCFFANAEGNYSGKVTFETQGKNVIIVGKVNLVVKSRGKLQAGGITGAFALNNYGKGILQTEMILSFVFLCVFLILLYQLFKKRRKNE